MWRQYFFALILREWNFRCVHVFQFLNVCDQKEYLLSKFLPRLTQTEENPGKTFWSRAQIGNIFNNCPKRNQWAFGWFSESLFIRSFPICQEVVDILQIAMAFHGISPTVFHPDLNATVQQTFLLLHCLPLSQQSHLFLICVVLTYNDSMIVSRFIFLVEDFVISRYQVTKLFCSRYWFAISSSARGPCDLGDLAISIFREVSKNTVLLGCHFCRPFRI